MKKFFIPLCLAILISACTGSASNSVAIVSGELLNNSVTKVVLSCKGTELIANVKDGKFEFQLDSLPGNYFKIQTELGSKDLFVEANDNIFISIGPEKGEIKYTGKGHEESSYLIDRNLLWEKTGLADVRNFPKKLNSYEYQEFIMITDSIRNMQFALIDKYIKEFSGFNTEFVNIEKNIALYKWMQHRFDYPKKHKKFTGNQARLADDYYSFVDNINTNDTILNDLPEYKSLIIGLIEYRTTQTVGDVERASPIDLLTARYTHVRKEIRSESFATRLASTILNGHIGRFGIDGVDSVYNDFLKVCENENMKNRMLNRYESWEHLKAGNKAPEFSINDGNSKEYHLSDFKGKYVYIAVLASYNNSYKEVLPELKELRTKLSRKNLEIITISFDTNMDKWKKILVPFQLKTINLFAGSSKNDFNEQYLSDRLPRYILIDKKGNLIHASANSPLEIEAELRKLLMN
ncbi:MAG: redoxin family protein [Bacteroidales bacterium]|nr:redoxin family protein [Bacteroidales bacterium]